MNELSVPVGAMMPEQQINTSPYSSKMSFEDSQRMAIQISKSDLVPPQFKGEKGIANIMIALEMAYRTGSSPLTVMQNLTVIQGRPTWSSQFITAQVNSCGRFSPLRYEEEGEGDNRYCIAVATDLETGETLKGPRVDIAMSKAEGWYNRNGSKWKTMPELMLRYRAATFFGRTYAPDLLLGLQTVDEIRDITVDPETGEVKTVTTRGVRGLKQRLQRGNDGQESI